MDAVKAAGRASYMKEILKEFRLVQKFRDFIGAAFHIKPASYMGLALTTRVLLSPYTDEQFTRLKVLIGSAVAGDNNPDILKEASAILDVLLSTDKINKMQYKLIYYKIKNLLGK